MDKGNHNIAHDVLTRILRLLIILLCNYFILNYMLKDFTTTDIILITLMTGIVFIIVDTYIPRVSIK